MHFFYMHGFGYIMLFKSSSIWRHLSQSIYLDVIQWEKGNSQTVQRLLILWLELTLISGDWKHCRAPLLAQRYVRGSSKWSPGQNLTYTESVGSADIPLFTSAIP